MTTTGGGGGGAAGTMIVISAFSAGVPGTPSAVSVSVYTTFVVESVFAGTVIVPQPLPVPHATDGSDSAAALAGSETAPMVHVSAFVVAKEKFTAPPLLEGRVVDCGVNESIVAVGPA